MCTEKSLPCTGMFAVRGVKQYEYMEKYLETVEFAKHYGQV